MAKYSRKDRERDPDSKGWVYLIQAESVGLVKIGHTSLRTPLKRVSDLQSGSPVELLFLAAFVGDRRDEKKTHLRFSKLRNHGEWFRWDNEIWEYFDERCEFKDKRWRDLKDWQKRIIPNYAAAND